MKSTGRIIVSLCFLIFSFSNCGQMREGNKADSIIEQPNILFIIGDDQAWTDYGFMGHPIVKTPNLDRLASESILFPRGYVTTAVCRPSLMTMITGLYPHQHKITGNDPEGGFSNAKYPREELLTNIDKLPTLPKLLGERGYLSHQSGKWWEGDYSRGGFTHGMTEGTRHGDKGLTIGRQGLDSIYHFIDYAVTENKPFYLWYAPFLPHTPHNPPQRLLDKYLGFDLSIHVAKYYAMIEWFDETCGQLINFLENRDIRENTLIYFVCDNGWIQKPNANGFDIGSKQTPMEGGVRTPILFSMPGKLVPTVRPELISSIDLFPTILGAAGSTPPDNLPGLNLWENLVREKEIDRKIIFGEGYGHDMIDKDHPQSSLAYLWCIEENWKLILCYDGKITGNGVFTHQEMRTQPVRLYDIGEDPSERINLVDQFPDVVENLKTKIENWYPLQERKLFVRN